MNNIFKFIMAIIALLVLCVLPSRAQVHHSYEVTSNAVMVVTGVSSNLPNSLINVIDIGNSVGRGASFQAYFATTNASTATVGFGFATSIDGVNYNNANLLWHFPALNGTTGVRSSTNFAGSVLDNVRKIKLVAITNGHTAALFYTNGLLGVFLDR